ncbi:amidohydrolase family protein [Roseiconus nitratireducens]|uniref:Amidohydrolase family protein n=1 Tax=Roseiconus nitratireducens TaxID=2605748 RepID=A0A5M6DD12_9BACT|nr:amidohydrolase family protein [Roseiconus nitratireducens]KAA5545293.1 amidohydrolase family protein [Roseiconus nitratireducens]
MPILGGQIVQSLDDGTAVFRPGVLEIEGERVARIHWGEFRNGVELGDAETLICPGFIDAHLHLPQFDSIGAAGIPLLRWLDEVIYPAEARWNDVEVARSMIARVAKQCLAFGTTGICAFAAPSQESTLAALETFSRNGFRGVIGQVMMDRDAPDDLLRETQQLVDQVQETLTRYPASGRMAAAVTPRFALTCSEPLLHAAGRLVADSGAVVQTHLAETLDECQKVSDNFAGAAYVDVYRQAGILTPRCLLGHGIHLDARARQTIAEHGAVIAHCPTANAFLGSGTMNRAAHQRSEISVALGSDIGAGFERSMVRVGRAMIEAAMIVRQQAGVDAPAWQTVPTAAHAWHQITAGNADALGWTDAGRIRPGGTADLVLIRPDIPWRDSPCPLSTLMYAWDDRWIRQTYLRGQVRYSSSESVSR